MAISVLVLWLLTACAGARLLFTSGLGGQRQPAAVPERVPEPAAVSATPAAASRREIRRAERRRYDPPALTRARNEPMPGLRDLAEFAHPALGITGLACWLGYSMVHNRVLAWIAFGLAVGTASLGLTWFTMNVRAARRRGVHGTGPVFSPRLILIHGSAAGLTFALAALTALTARG
jgi:hypothetical protein